METELNRESTVDESAQANDLQIADMDETSNAGSDDGEGQNVGTLTVSSPNFMLLQHGNCRICYAPAVASGEDPMLELGCHCRDDLRFGHQSCLTEWFVRRVLSNGIIDCEVCRSSLATHLETIVMSSIQEVVSELQTEGVPRILHILQVPLQELDRLEVPLETPNFYELSPETRQIVLSSLRRQEELHQLGVTRRTANFMMAQNLAIQGEGPLRADQLQARIRRANELRNEDLGVFRMTDENMEMIQEIFGILVSTVHEFLGNADELETFWMNFLCMLTSLAQIQVEI